jgi:hypothetical protein
MRLAVLLVLAAACKSAPESQPAPEAAPGAQRVPEGPLAHIVNPSPQSRAALAQAVRDALDGVPVMLAEDALTRESTLILERPAHRDPEGHRAQGRELGRPERFTLYKSGGDCVLVHERTGRRMPLVATECATAP